jgi:catabolite regulation protein CreA
MGLDLRLPNITATTEREQLVQIKSYLYQLAQQLQWALNTVETQSTSNNVAQRPSQSVIVQAKEEDAEVTFNSLKSLIIKSADIVDAYYDEISKRLTGLYVAQSDFGTYIEETALTIEANSQGITQNYENVQQIITNIEALNISLLESQAHIHSGILYYDDIGHPVYGLEIGQRNTVDGEEVFNKYARFTSDRLSFYDQNNSEVAYISDYKMYVTNVEVTGVLRLGAFQIDTTKGFNLKYVGRG